MFVQTVLKKPPLRKVSRISVRGFSFDKPGPASKRGAPVAVNVVINNLWFI